MALGFAEVISKSINYHIKQICMVMLFLLVLVVAKFFLLIFNHDKWSGKEPLVPGVYNPNNPY